MEVTHCNIIAMAMKSEPSVQREKNVNFHRLSRDGNGCHDLQQFGKETTEISVSCTYCMLGCLCTHSSLCLSHFFPPPAFPLTPYTASSCLFHTCSFFFSSSFPLSISVPSAFPFTACLLSSSFLFRWPVARSPLVSEECVFH